MLWNLWLIWKDWNRLCSDSPKIWTKTFQKLMFLNNEPICILNSSIPGEMEFPEEDVLQVCVSIKDQTLLENNRCPSETSVCGQNVH